MQPHYKPEANRRVMFELIVTTLGLQQHDSVVTGVVGEKGFPATVIGLSRQSMENIMTTHTNLFDKTRKGLS